MDGSLHNALVSVSIAAVVSVSVAVISPYSAELVKEF
jgi:hypothetical protein